MIDLELLERLNELEEKVAFADQHVRDAATQIGQLEHLVVDVLGRLARVENKTACLSDQPGRKNCPHCHKIVNNPLARTCQHCGYAFIQ